MNYVWAAGFTSALTSILMPVKHALRTNFANTKFCFIKKNIYSTVTLFGDGLNDA